MALRSHLLTVSACSIILASFLIGQSASAQTIWSGYTKSFTKPSFSDPNLPQNQDPLTANVVLTRGSAGGLINIAVESAFNATSSPTGTLWATDQNNPGKTIAATNWEELAFTNWLDAYGGQHTMGSLIPGRNAVVKLTSEVAAEIVYLDLRFTTWSSGTGGGYSYLRAEPPPSLPTGDYNNNQVVDAADYVVWRHTLGEMGIPLGSGADGNSNGEIDPGDYTFWRERFGNSVGGVGLAAAGAVPEPTAAFPAICCGVLCVRRTRRLSRG